MEKQNYLNQIKAIRKILIQDNSNMKSCKHCNFTYIPMTEETEAFCPICQEKELKEYKENLYFYNLLDE